MIPKPSQRPQFWQSVAWIAANDNPGDDENAEAIASYMTVVLVAAVFHWSARDVAEEVVKLRARWAEEG